MASDSQFDIEIKLGLNKTGADAAANKLKELKAQTTETGKEGVKQEKEVADATQKTLSKKQQLKDMVKGLGHEFPILGQIGRMALNPITLSVAAISAAAVILKEKLKEVGEVMQTEKWDASKINAAAEAWEKFSSWVKASAVAAAELEKKLAAIVAYTQTINRLAAAKAQDLSSNPLFARRNEEAKAAEMDKAAKAAEETAAKMRADAATIKPRHRKEEDEATQVTLDKEAATAAVEIAKLDAEIKGLQVTYSQENKNNIRYLPERLAAAAKYGAYTDPEEMIKALQDQRAGYQGFVDRASGARTRTQTINAQRTAATDLESKAAEFSSFAEKNRASARDVRFNAGLSYYESAQAQGVTPSVRNEPSPWGVTPDIKQYFDAANADLKRVAEEWAAAAAAMRASAEKEAAAAANRTARP